MDTKTKIIIIVLLFAISAASVGYFYVESIRDSKINLPDTSQKEIVKVTAEPKIIVPEKKYKAEVVELDGQAFFKNDGDEEWKEIKLLETIDSETEVRTGSESKIVILLEDGSEARLDSSSRAGFVISEKSIELNLFQGAIYNKVAKNNQRTYSVNSADYSIKALGTIFSVKMKDGGVSEVITLENQIAIKDKRNSGADKQINSGKIVALKKLGISEDDISESAIKEKFIAWNIEKDKLDIKTKEDILKEAAGKFILTAKEVSQGVEFEWKTDDLKVKEGFKILKSEKLNPTYPGNEYKFINSKDIRKTIWEMKNGDEYHFRICLYEGGKCLFYSNDIKPKDTIDDEDDYAYKISLSVEKDDDDVKLEWKIYGGEAPQGFKVVMDEDEDPKYPDDKNKYIDDSSERDYTWKDLDLGKTYHFRVCVYKDGKCKVYSDDEEVNFEDV